MLPLLTISEDFELDLRLDSALFSEGTGSTIGSVLCSGVQISISSTECSLLLGRFNLLASFLGDFSTPFSLLGLLLNEASFVLSTCGDLSGLSLALLGLVLSFFDSSSSSSSPNSKGGCQWKVSLGF